MTIQASIETILPKRPAHIDDLAVAVRMAAAANAQVQISGSNSLQLARFFAAERAVQPISTLKLNKVIEHAADDRKVSVGAGITLEALQKQLAWHNQWLPVDPPGMGGKLGIHRTLGGLIASNTLGPLRASCGEWRMLMLGARWVGASGTIINSGDGAGENDGTYASQRMLIGSFGDLGIFGEITLRTFPRPEDEQAVVFFCDSAKQAGIILAAMLRDPLQPAYLQIVGRAGFLTNNLQLPAGRMMVVAGFLDCLALCEAQVRAARGLPEARTAEMIALGNAQAGRLRAWMTSELVGQLAFRIQTRSNLIPPLVAGLEKEATQLGGSCWLVAEGAAGVIRGVALNLPEDAVAKFFMALKRWTLDAGARVWITMSAHPGIAAGTLYPESAGRDIFRRLKEQLDPHKTFGSLGW